MRRPRITAAAFVTLAALASSPQLAQATPLLPLAPGQLTVLLGDRGQWQPQSGTPLTLTLLAGPARTRRDLPLSAFVTLQPVGKACGDSPAADHEPQLDLGTIYSAQTLVGAGSPLAPHGGADPRVHAASTPVIVNASRTVRTCIWLDTTTKKRARPITQDIPLLNGVFAASVWATGTPASGYELDAMSVGNGFQYTVSSDFCNQTSTGPQGRIAAGQEESYAVSISSIDCPVDGSMFVFSGPGGSSLGSISYTDAQAASSPPAIGHTGGCELDGASGLSVGAARRYVATVGCSVHRVLTAPYSGTVARGAVTEAQVDGGIAPIAPAGTAVDLVING